MRIDHWVFFVCLHTYVFFSHTYIHTYNFFLRCQYAGIDVSGPFLEEAYKNLMQSVDGLQHDDMDMVQADYMEGLKIVREHYPHENVCILWLGSSVGNLSASAAVQFFCDAVAAVGTHCQILLCTGKWLHAPLHSLDFTPQKTSC